MTKIAYIRASQQNPGLQFGSHPHQTATMLPSSPVKGPYQHQHQHQQPSMMMPTSPIQGPHQGPTTTRPFFHPPMPGAPQAGSTGISFPPVPSIGTHLHHQSQSRVPKPLMMTPTTRFNSNPTVFLTAEQSAPGGRISKPLMEKRRRARINQCLSQLKHIVVDSAGQYTEGNKCKLEKADILELTVKYVQKLHEDVQLAASTKDPQGASSSSSSSAESYVSGYSDCIRSVCEFITTTTTTTSTTSLKESLHSHLSQSLLSLTTTSNSSSQNPESGIQQQQQQQQQPESTPLSPPNSSNASSPEIIAFPTFHHHHHHHHHSSSSSSSLCAPPSPAPSSLSSNSSSSNSTSSLVGGDLSRQQVNMNLNPHQVPVIRSLKRAFSHVYGDDEDDEDEEEEEDYEDVSDEELLLAAFAAGDQHSGPINLSAKMARPRLVQPGDEEPEDDSMWRPW